MSAKRPSPSTGEKKEPSLRVGLGVIEAEAVVFRQLGSRGKATLGRPRLSKNSGVGTGRRPLSTFGSVSLLFAKNVGVPFEIKTREKFAYGTPLFRVRSSKFRLDPCEEQSKRASVRSGQVPTPPNFLFLLPSQQIPTLAWENFRKIVDRSPWFVMS